MFFIIWGSRVRAANVAMLQLACRNGHVAAHRIVKVTRWFTLFFVPVVPMSRRYRSVCAGCGLTLDLPKDVAEEMVGRLGEAPAAPGDPVAPPVPAAGSYGRTDGGEDTSISSGALPPAGPPAGWYPDPAGGPGRRWWDGRRWTEAVHQD